MVVAQNPCPCGYYGDSKKECTCTIGQVQKYNQKISGPLLDRIDMHIEVPPVAIKKLASSELSEASSIVRSRVSLARKRQLQRFDKIDKLSNTELSVSEIKRMVVLTKKGERLLQKASETLLLSARGYFRVIRVAQTISDLKENDEVDEAHIAEALQFRQKINF